MIDITPYQQRLEWLREWLYKKIDGKLPDDIVETRVEQVMAYTLDQLIRIYNQTGMLINQYPNITSIMRPMNFQEYCKYKQSLCQSQNTSTVTTSF